MSHPYEAELKIAQLAVQRAVLLTKRVLPMDDKGTVEKSDESEVTIADLAAQALLISAIHHNFPSDVFIAEESADLLRQDPRLRKRVWELVSSTHLEHSEGEGLLYTPSSQEEMLDTTDLGSYHPGGVEGRIWMLDPIDGTLTFLRGQQFAVCLSLVEDGQEEVGVLGCPNLILEAGKASENQVDKEGYGLMLSAVRGHGASVTQLSSGSLSPPRRIERKTVTELQDLSFVDDTISTLTNSEHHRLLAEKLGAPWPGTDLFSQQMKYVALAIGGCDVMVRLPRESWHRAAVWDHAGGHLIFTESGGKVTDENGLEFDFGAGRRLYRNFGAVAAPVGVHDRVLELVKEILGGSEG
ncbi:hypothetical protein FGG08_001115 [Glutinoglossum americanum]|uniref:3'(2'),5'-bisphosphate nucleotidase n=1 Tax=Glutinoglossum americanum TaxID=1670608 RepID=A0A9P8IHA6_9PEZI|nr:hypothetical protein FGG08_001115 [Glutinoglossum americanum]